MCFRTCVDMLQSGLEWYGSNGAKVMGLISREHTDTDNMFIMNE